MTSTPARPGTAPALQPKGKGAVIVQPKSALAVMPDKVPGRHRWMARSWHTVSDTLAAALTHGARVTFKPETTLVVQVGCVDCQLAYQLVKDQPCSPVEDSTPVDDVTPPGDG